MLRTTTVQNLTSPQHAPASHARSDSELWVCGPAQIRSVHDVHPQSALSISLPSNPSPVVQEYSTNTALCQLPSEVLFSAFPQRSALCVPCALACIRPTVIRAPTSSTQSTPGSFCVHPISFLADGLSIKRGCKYFTTVVLLQFYSIFSILRYANIHCCAGRFSLPFETFASARFVVCWESGRCLSHPWKNGTPPSIPSLETDVSSSIIIFLSAVRTIVSLVPLFAARSWEWPRLVHSRQQMHKYAALF
ncbi:hypothetical protein BDW74DRAFT_61002 [Aspergillus multicolor]|uniref:uncharacterized protein n=1 Tax=Aspergillus multicolor TaxID=41759 RepID=UPI003CCDF1C5